MKMEWWEHLILVICLTVGFVIGTLVGSFITSEVVEVNLVNANADLAGGEVAWEFEVEGREVPGGESVRVFNDNFKIQVIEFGSQKVVDELNVGGLLEKGDLV